MAFPIAAIIGIGIALLAGGASYVQAKQAQKKAKKLANSMAGVLLNKESNIEPLPVIYGTRRVGGVRVFVETSGPNNEYLYMALALCEGEVGSIAGIEIDGVSRFDARFSGFAAFQTHNGSDDQSVSSLLIGAPSWTVNHRLRGVAYLSVRLKWDQNVFSGIPEITALVTGKRVYDPRTGNTTWSSNPALCIRDYLTNTRYGKGLPASAIDDDAFSDAADDCDNFTVTPYSGATSTIKLFQCNAVIDTGEEIFRNVEKMLLGCRGFLPYTNGKYALYIDQSKTHTLDLTLDNIIGGITFAGEKKEDKFNRVIVKFPNPSTKWQEDAAIWPDAGSTEESTYLGEDNNVLLVDEVEMETVTNYYSARDFARIFLLRSRNGIRVSLQATSEAINLVVGDVVRLTHPTPSFTNKPFQVEQVTLNYDGTVNLDLLEYDSTIYTYDTAAEETDYPDTDLPDPFTVAAPTGLTLTESTRTEGDGTIIPSVLVEWTAADDSFVNSYEVQYKLTTATTYKSLITGATEFDLTLPESGADYDIQVRSINSAGVRSSFVTDQVSIVGDNVAPGTPSNGSTSADVHLLVVTWDNPSDSDFSYTEVKRSNDATEGNATSIAKISGESFTDGPFAVGTTRYYWLRAVDRTGNASSWVSAGSDTTVAVDTPDIKDNAVTITKIADTLQSTNYSAGSAGWKLTTGGVFEAGDGTFRGDITAKSFTIEAGATVSGIEAQAVAGLPQANFTSIGASTYSPAVNGSRVTWTETSTDVSWNTKLVSDQSFSGGAFVTFVVNKDNATNSRYMVGLANGGTGNSYTDIDYAIFVRGTSSDILAYESGNSPGTLKASLNAGDICTVFYDGNKVQYIINGTVEREVNLTSPLTGQVYAHIAIDDGSSHVEHRIDGLQFGPVTSVVENLNDGVSLTSGGLTLSSGGAIKGGQTAYDNGTGFFLGYENSAYKLSIGDSTGDKLTFNGADLTVTGDITATSLTLSGTSIAESQLAQGVQDSLALADSASQVNRGLALLLNQTTGGTSNSGEASLVGVDKDGNPETGTDGFIIWNGDKITVERNQYGGSYSILTNAASKTGFIVFDVNKTQPFSDVGTAGNDTDVAFVWKIGSQWYYDANNNGNTFTPSSVTGNRTGTDGTTTPRLVALGYMQTGSVDTIIKGGLFGEPVDLELAAFPTDVIQSGSVGGVTITDSKLYQGAGTFQGSTTGFYLDSAGQFSLKDKFSFDGTELFVDGNIEVSDYVRAGSGANAAIISGRDVDEFAFWAGAGFQSDGGPSGGNAPFRVTRDGKVIMTNFALYSQSGTKLFDSQDGLLALPQTAVAQASGTLVPQVSEEITDTTTFTVTLSSTQTITADFSYPVGALYYSGTSLSDALNNVSSAFAVTLEYSDDSGSTWNTFGSTQNFSRVTSGTPTSSQFFVDNRELTISIIYGAEPTTIFIASLQSDRGAIDEGMALVGSTSQSLAAGTYLIRMAFSATGGSGTGAPATNKVREVRLTTSGAGFTVSNGVVSDGVGTSATTGWVLQNFVEKTESDNVTINGTLTLGGDLVVNGTTTTINSTTMTVNDKNIVLADGAANAAAADGAGITIDGAGASFTYNSTANAFQTNKLLEPSALRVNDSSDMGFGVTKAGSSVAHTASVDEGIFWHTTNDYGIYRTAGAWSSPDYPYLKIAFGTGIKLDGGTAGQYTYTGVDIVGGSDLQMAGNTVIDASRNITANAITTSGAVTVNNNLNVNGGYAFFNGEGAEYTSLEPVLWARSKTGASVVQLNVQGDQWQFGGGGTIDTTPTMVIDYGSNTVTMAGSFTAQAGAGGIGGVLKSTSSWSSGVLNGPGLIWQEADGTNIAGIRGYVDANGNNNLAIGTGWLDQELTVTSTGLAVAGNVAAGGNLTSSGINASSNKVVLGGSSFANMSNAVSVAIGSAWMGSSASLFVNGFSRYNGNLYISDGGDTNYVGIGYSNGKVTAVGGNGSGIDAFNAPDGYYVGNTQVVDGSRNLVNIGTIDSGAIVSSANVKAVGVYGENVGHAEAEILFAISDHDNDDSLKRKFGAGTGNSNLSMASDPDAPASGIFEVDGNWSPIWGPYIPIDDDTEIVFECWVKFISGTTGGKLYVGGQFYDGNKSSLGNNYRYWGASGQAVNSTTHSSWQHIKGVMKGSAIRAGSATSTAQYFRFLTLFNYQGSDNVTRFCGYRFYVTRKTVTSLYHKKADHSAGYDITGFGSTYTGNAANDVVQIIDNSGNINTAGEFKVAGSTAIDASRNVYANYSLLGRSIRASGRGELHLNGTSASSVSEIFFGWGNGYAGNDNNIRWGISDRGTTDGHLRFYKGPANSPGGSFDTVAEFSKDTTRLNVMGGYEVNGTTRINSVGDGLFTSLYIGSTNIVDTSRNLTNIGDASLSGELVVNSANTAAKYLWINKGSGDGGILWRLSNALKFQNVLSGNDLAWYSYELASTAFVMYGSGEFTAKNGYQVNGTTVINASRGAILSADSSITGGRLTITDNTDALRIYTTTNGVGANIAFSDHVTTTRQTGYLTYYHADGSSYGSGNAFTFTSTEASLSVAVDGKLITSDGLYLGGSSSSAGNVMIDADGILHPLCDGSSQTNGGVFLAPTYSAPHHITTFSTHYSSGVGIWGYGAAGKSGSGASTLVSTFSNFNASRSAVKLQADLFSIVGTSSAVQTAVGSDLSVVTRFSVGTTDGATNVYGTLTTSGAIDAARGMHGGYATTTGSGTAWGSCIWSIGVSWNGSNTGTSYSIGTYGLHWLRNSHPSEINYASEGLYLTRSSTTPYAAIGYNGAYFTTRVATTDNITAYYSDERLKQKTGGIENALDKVRSLEGFTYVENELARELGYNNNKEQVGLSAQQVQAVLPHAVSLAPVDFGNEVDGEIVSKSGEDYLTVDYSRLVPLLVESIKELSTEVERLKKLLEKDNGND